VIQVAARHEGRGGPQFPGTSAPERRCAPCADTTWSARWAKPGPLRITPRWSPFSLLQKNVLNRRSWTTREQLRIAIITWIERTYRRRRRQPGLARLTLVEYELIMAPTAVQAA
jgi:transposase InsO family protein